MHIGTHLVFDQQISGTGTAWYTSSDFNQVIGSGNLNVVQAVVTGVSGSPATLTVASEHSVDGEHWIATGSTEINAQSMLGGFTNADEPTITGSLALGVVVASNIRYKINLGGTTPACRLKLYVSVRSSATA